MAYTIISQIPAAGGAWRNEIIMDSADDAASLPASAPGSVAIVADKDGAVFMRNASGEWKEQ